MRGVNKVILVGRLGKAPEVKYTPGGDAVCNLAVATSETWNDASGEPQEKTEWHRVVAFKRLAEIMGEFLHKGSMVYLEGKIQTKKWQDQSGNDRYTTEIIARDMQMLDGANGQSQPGQQQGSQQQQRQQTNTQRNNGQQQGGNTFDDFDDDIPF